MSVNTWLQSAVGSNKKMFVTSLNLPCHMCSSVQNQLGEMNEAIFLGLIELNMKLALYSTVIVLLAFWT